MARHLTRGHKGLLLLLAALLAVLPTSAAARESRCPELIKKQSPAAASASKSSASEGNLEAVNGEGVPIPKATLVMDFGSKRNREVRTQTYRLSGNLNPDTVRVAPVNDFVSGNKPLPIGHEQLTYRVGVDKATGLVNVRVCYDPGGYAEPTPGRYVGAMMVSVQGAAAVPMAVEFTVRDNELAGVVIALLIGIVAGALVQAIAMYQQAPQDTRPSGWRPYLFNLRTLVSVGAGVVAAIATYSKAVDGDPTWNATAATLLSLASATFFGTLAAKTAADLKGPTEKEKKKGLAQ
ncbi:MAG TPA: hypothetical protein VFM94_10215 [Solirubrobacterales bacterium]|nr:hypothetical protein [Solirubrobacterales bacterium]